MIETVEIMTVTPKMAKDWLEEQEQRIAKGEHRSRTLNEKTVRRYINDIKRDHWPVNTSGIGFDSKGNLTNGRHRLWAISRSGKSIKTAVFRGLAPQGVDSIAAMDTEDSGRQRTVSQQLRMDGESYAELMAATARVVGCILSNDSDVRMSLIPTREVLDIYKTHILKSIEVMAGKSKLLRGFLLGPVAIYRAKHREKSDEFCNDWLERANLGRDNPVLALQRFFDSFGSSHGGREGTMAKYQHVALALHHYDAGNKINTIRRSDIGCDWLRKLTPGNTRKVNEIIGVDALAEEHKNEQPDQS